MQCSARKLTTIVFSVVHLHLIFILAFIHNRNHIHNHIHEHASLLFSVPAACPLVSFLHATPPLSAKINQNAKPKKCKMKTNKKRAKQILNENCNQQPYADPARFCGVSGIICSVTHTHTETQTQSVGWPSLRVSNKCHDMKFIYAPRKTNEKQSKPNGMLATRAETTIKIPQYKDN